MKIEVYLDNINNPLFMECRGDTLFIGPSGAPRTAATEQVQEQPWGLVKKRLWEQHKARREAAEEPTNPL